MHGNVTLRVAVSISFCSLVALALSVIWVDGALAQSGRDGLDFFESNIRPVLIKHCYECHSRESGVSEGGLSLDTKDGLRRGGRRGPAIIEGQPDESRLIIALSHTDPDLQMPPQDEPLSAAVVNDFKQWIRAGAIDPRQADVPAHDWSKPARDFWAYQPIQAQVPATERGAWFRRDVDRFIWEKLREAGLSPSPDARPETLLRRLHFDLTGLPPEPILISGFVRRCESLGVDQALVSEVDRLLESPRFGERWGRHWLDVARFAESSGREANISFPYAWRYRDYVIDAINADLPFDRFLTEQLAGDRLPAENAAERTRLLIATGFLALGPKNLDEANEQQFAADLVDEQIDTVSRVFMASSIACARCHDHKFDPFSMDDYYALAGIFRSTRTFFGTGVSPANRVGGDPLELPRLESTAILHNSIPADKVKRLQAERTELQSERARKGAEFTLRDALRVFWRTGAIDLQLEKVDDQGNALPLAMGVTEGREVENARIFLRGDVNSPGELVERGFPSAVLGIASPRIEEDSSGRLALAKWLTQPEHPLTSRVVVNRVWSHVFGDGLVRSVDDFGSTGERPSHPQLLDYLAKQFVDHSWSLKWLVRELVLSRTYRQMSSYQPDAFQIDPHNRLLWRMSKRRLEAEAMRDAMLSVSGQLELRRPQGSLVGRVIGDKPISLIGLDKRLPEDLDGAVHRSVFLPVLRNRLPDLFNVFDFAEPSLVTGQREETNVPTQALYLMNSEFAERCAASFAARLEDESRCQEELVVLAFQYCYARRPTGSERQRVLEYLRGSELGKSQSGDSTHKEKSAGRLVACCQALMSTVEFRVLD